MTIRFYKPNIVAIDIPENIKDEYLEKEYVMSLANNIDMNFGYIICVCDLVDCIYMTEEFIENIKKNEKIILNYWQFL